MLLPDKFNRTADIAIRVCVVSSQLVPSVFVLQDTISPTRGIFTDIIGGAVGSEMFLCATFHSWTITPVSTLYLGNNIHTGQFQPVPVSHFRYQCLHTRYIFYQPTFLWHCS